MSGRAHRGKPPSGTTFLFTLNEAARVSLTIAHGARGRLSGRHCVKPSKRLRSHRACTRQVLDGTLTRRALGGAYRVAFSGRIGRRALAPGSHTVTLLATAFGLTTNRRTLRFSIVRSRLRWPKQRETGA